MGGRVNNIVTIAEVIEVNIGLSLHLRLVDNLLIDRGVEGCRKLTHFRLTSGF